MDAEQELYEAAERLGKKRPRPGPKPKSPMAKKKPTVLYDSSKKNFWVEIKAGQWIQYSEKSLSRILRSYGFSRDEWEANDLSKLENEIMRIETQENVEWAGQIAGYQAGLHETAGQSILVTKGPDFKKPKKRDWSTIKKFVHELLGEEAIYFYGWVKCALDALDHGPPWRPGQVFCIAGPADCGKSFLQGIITEIFGGRAADPFDYLSGDTGFNGDLFRAEHLAIGDKMSSGEKRNRKRFGANIKNLLYEDLKRCNDKGKTALPLAPFWRLSISLNDDAEYITLLPPLDGSTRDKFILLKCSKATFPYGDNDLDGRSRFRQTLVDELPGLLWYLKGWQIPKELSDRRTGIIHYANAEIAQKLADFEEEFLLLTLIDKSTLIPADAEDWRGSAEDLREFLCQWGNSDVTKKLFRFSNACGTYLSRLAAKENSRVHRFDGPGHTSMWQVFKPGVDNMLDKLAKHGH